MSYKIDIEITQKACNEFFQNRLVYLPKDNFIIKLNGMSLSRILIDWEYVPLVSTDNALLKLELKEKINIEQEVILTSFICHEYPQSVRYKNMLYKLGNDICHLEIQVKKK